MPFPDPYRPQDRSDHASSSDTDVNVQNLPTDAEVRGLTTALAASGGGSTSGDLALDLVLNQIVEQACLATGASGAAIALTREREMVCRATTGRNAPDLGVRLDTAGFSADCLRMGTLQRCDDTETDPRVDATACRLLGVRSILVIPLWYWGEFMGILEIFSPRPNAFGERDEQTLQALAYRIVRHAKQVNGQITGFPASSEELPAFVSSTSTQAKEPTSLPEPLPMPVIELNSAASPEEFVDLGRRDAWTIFLAGVAVVIACGIVALMVWRIALKPPVRRAAASTVTQRQAPIYDTVTLGSGDDSRQPNSAPAASPVQSARDDLRITPASKKDSLPPATRETVTGGGLAIYDENGKLIYGEPIPDPDRPVARKPLSRPKPPEPKTELRASSSAPPPAQKADLMVGRSTPPPATGFGPAGKYVTITSDIADKLVIDRVEPDYPDAARRAGAQGSIKLDTFIAADGRVQQVSPLSGNPVLAEAASAAVRRWRYKPYTVKGRKVPVHTEVVVNFMLAQ
jgi:TonB family protein